MIDEGHAEETGPGAGGQDHEPTANQAAEDPMGTARAPRTPDEPVGPGPPRHSANAPDGPLPGEEPEAVWTFRGYQLRPSDFTTAMAHLYRGEISRSNTWRIRLDATTNWAVITTGAAISIAFTSQAIDEHGVIILNTLLITLFLHIEARRYRYYELWSYRVRLMETDFFAAMLVPPFRPARDWAESLAEHLLEPSFPVSMLEAWGRRYRRNYLWIYMLLALAWVLKLAIHPVPVTSVDEFVARAGVGWVPGWVVIATGVVFNAVLFAIGVGTVGLQHATGEVLPRYSAPGGRQVVRDLEKEGRDIRTRLRPTRRREELVALVVTDHPEQVAERVLTQMVRGVTRLQGEGMYTGRPRSVLMTALTVTEVKQFQGLAKEGDPNAFVMVMPARQVMGSGFAPLGDGAPSKTH